MALQIEIKSDNGVLLSYHMIAMISVDAVINPITNHYSFFMING